jgi:hypothetical protein
MNINVSHPIQTRDGFDINAAQRGLKGQKLMTLMRTQDLSIARTPVEGAVRPKSYRGCSGYTNTVSDNQVMGQSGNLGSYLNGSDQFVVGPCLIAPIFSAITPSLRCHGEHYEGAEKNTCWRGTIAESGTPIYQA